MRKFTSLVVENLMRAVFLAAILFVGVNSGVAAEEGAPRAEPKSGSKASALPAAHVAAVAKINEVGGAVRRIARNTKENEVSLALAPPPILDEILSSVANVEELVWLELQGTSITDKGLESLAGVTTLRRLHLERTGVTDDGLKHLAGMSELEYLNLYGTKVTDAGLRHLKPLAKLRKLFVWGSDVSDKGIESLSKSMPELTVIGAAKPMVDPPDLAVEETVKEKEEALKAPEHLLAEGSIVRISLSDEQYLSLAEVAVLRVGKTDPMKGKATQSSTYNEGSANLATDGDRNGDFHAGSVSHTLNDAGEWWQLTLPESRDIGAIHIWNRSDCCADRLSAAVVEILDDDENVVWTETIKEGVIEEHYMFVGKE